MSNRVIKFRAFYPHSKEMISWETMTDDYYNIGFLNSETAIIMQFTGLHDKNSKEIYEGDRLVYNGKVYDVTFNQDYSGYCLDRSLSIHGENESIRFDCDVAILSEVKGNIYQNPEFLNKLRNMKEEKSQSGQWTLSTNNDDIFILKLKDDEGTESIYITKEQLGELKEFLLGRV